MPGASGGFSHRKAFRQWHLRETPFSIRGRTGGNSNKTEGISLVPGAEEIDQIVPVSVLVELTRRRHRLCRASCLSNLRVDDIAFAVRAANGCWSNRKFSSSPLPPNARVDEFAGSKPLQPIVHAAGFAAMSPVEHLVHDAYEPRSCNVPVGTIPRNAILRSRWNISRTFWIASRRPDIHDLIRDVPPRRENHATGRDGHGWERSSRHPGRAVPRAGKSFDARRSRARREGRRDLLR